MERLHVLEAQRALLVCRSAQQREQLAIEFVEWNARAEVVDHWVDRIYRFRVVAGAATGILTLFGLRSRRRLSGWVRGASVVYGLVRAIRRKRQQRDQ